MTADGFRKIALGFPDVTESFHMDHPDFRVAGKVFATLGYPDKSWGMVRLTPRQQALVVAAEPDAYMPVKGSWGRRGATNVSLRAVKKKSLSKALEDAWANLAPRHLFPGK
jgi:hypothetical protein